MGKKEQKMVPVKVYRPKEKIDVSRFYAEAEPIRNYGELQKVSRRVNQFIYSKLDEMDVETIMVPEKPGSEVYAKMRIKKGKMNQSGKNYEIA